MKYFVLVVMIGFFALLFFSNFSKSNAQMFRVTICHATASSTNPYNKITVSPNAINGVGRSDHNRDGHQNGEDIIPPGFWDFDGRNWDSEGQAIYNNDCNPVTSPTPTSEPSPSPTSEPSPSPTSEPSPSPTREPSPTGIPSPTPNPNISGNICEINNSISANSSTGRNLINRVAGGFARIFTGDSSMDINLSSKCNYNYASIELPIGELKINVSENGSHSQNIVKINKSSSLQISQ